MTVPQILNQLHKKAEEIGCILVIGKKEGFPMGTVSIICDNKMSREMLELGSVDGLFVWVKQKDMDKNAKHSNYYKQLIDLERRFDECRDRLMKRAHVLSCSVETREGYFDALRKC